MLNRQSRTSRRAVDAIPVRTVDWRRLLHYLQPYRRHMLGALLALAGASAINLGFPLVIVQLLEAVLQQGDQTLLTNLTLALIALFFLQAFLTFLQGYILNVVGERIVLDMRVQLYRHLHTLSLSFFASRRVGEIVSRISSDVTQVRSILTNNVTQFLSSIVALFGAIIIVDRKSVV